MNKQDGPEPVETSSEMFVTVRVGEGEPESDSVFVLPASHLTRPRLAPLVAMAEDGNQSDVIRIRCRLSYFVEAMVRTAVEEAQEGRTACGVVVDPSDADAGVNVSRLLKWMLEQAPSPSRSSPPAQQHTAAPPSPTISSATSFIKATMSFLRRQNKKHAPEPAETTSSEMFVTVHVGEGEPQFGRVFVLPASHLTRPRLAPLVAAAEAGHHGDVIRIQCRLCDFAEAMARTAIEEADEERTACGRVVAPSVADPGLSVLPILKYKHLSVPGPLPEHNLRARQAKLRWLLDPTSCDASVLEQALTGDSYDLRAACEVITSRTPAQLEILRQNYKKASSAEAVATHRTKKTWGQRISERLQIVPKGTKVTTPKPSPETPPPPPPITFRPTWARNRRMSVSSSQ